MNVDPHDTALESVGRTENAICFSKCKMIAVYFLTYVANAVFMYKRDVKY